MRTVKLVWITLIISLVCSISQAQHPYHSEYLHNPELLIDFVNDCADFWAVVHDDAHGGFFVDVGRSGNVLDNSYKGMVAQSRDAFGFTKAFMLTGNEDYLTIAQSALDFMYQHQYDEDYGGWFSGTSADGSNPNLGDKTAFDQHYALLGPTAYFEATHDSAHWEMISKGLSFLEQYYWDNDPVQFGYYNQAGRTGANAYGKSFNATVDAITTHLYTLYMLSESKEYKERLNALKTNILDHLLASMAQQKIGFAEEYNTNWSINESHQRTIMGHVLKTGWCLGRIHRMEPDQQALDGAKALIQNVLDKGYDHVNGGPYKDYNRKTGEMMMYGAYDKAKAWWQMEQAITAGFMMYEITYEEKYLNMADESLDFYMNYFVDPEYGEVYADRSETGGRVRYNGGYWDENKGSSWKSAYHSIETAYFAYIYGKLLLKREPVTLFYHFEPHAEPRNIKLTPLAVNFNNLKIAEVSKDGVAFSNFDAEARTVSLGANEQGVFAVSYQLNNLPAKVITGEPIATLNDPFKVYPTVAERFINIQFRTSVNRESMVSLIDAQGRVILQQSISDLQANSFQRINTENINTGVYIISVTSEGKNYQRKFIKR